MPNTPVANPPVLGGGNSFLTSLSDTSLIEWNGKLEKLDATARTEWSMEHLPGHFVLSSSFGIQSAVMLHLLTQVDPNIPVILTDTGHLFPETYFLPGTCDKKRRV